MRGKEKPSGKYDMLDVVQVVPRKNVEYDAGMGGGELGPYEVAT